MEKDPIEIAQLIVRGEYYNFSLKKPFINTSGIYRFTNEDISSYFHHLKNKKNVLTVIGSGGQILNGVLAGTRRFDCFDISVFPEYYLYLQIASVLSLSKEEYLDYYFSDDREIVFGDDYYDRIRINLPPKYKDFWDSLYDFDDGYDIYNSLLFRSDPCLKKFVLSSNPYLQDDNYQKLRHLLQTENITINPRTCDIFKERFKDEYDLVNLSNILSYYYTENDKEKYIAFLKDNFLLTPSGEIINYFYDMSRKNEQEFNSLLQPNGYVESLDKKKLLVYKK